MKILLSLTCSILLSTTLIAQSNLNWSTLNTSTTKNINDIYFLSPDTGYIVGDDYLFKKTTDGGATWSNLIAPTIGEKPGNNGKIIDIEYYKTPLHGFYGTGLYIIWENGYHGVSTNDDGLSYNIFPYSDSSQFCKTEGFSILPAQGSGYVNLFTYGENCSGNAEYYYIFDGPFSVSRTEIFTTSTNAHYTTVDADDYSNIFGHSDGYLLKFRSLFWKLDTIFLDSSGVAAVTSAGNNTWYAHTNRNFNNMYVSLDSGKTFQVDSTYPNTFFYPKINDFDFLSNGTGIAAATSNGINGSIVVRDSNRWEIFGATEPLRAAKLFSNGTAYVAGDNGLVMKTTILTSTKEVDKQDNILQVHPNPADDYLQLVGLENLNVESIQLFNIKGKLIRTFSSTERRLNLSDYSEGMYIVKVIVEGKQLTNKVIVR